MWVKALVSIVLVFAVFVQLFLCWLWVAYFLFYSQAAYFYRCLWLLRSSEGEEVFFNYSLHYYILFVFVNRKRFQFCLRGKGGSSFFSDRNRDAYTCALAFSHNDIFTPFLFNQFSCSLKSGIFLSNSFQNAVEWLGCFKWTISWMMI